VKSRPTDVLDVVAIFATVAPVGCESQVTLCATLWNAHVTVPVPLFLTMVTVPGVKVSPVVAATVAVLEGAVTVTA
jgi:hypothetical protein